MEKQETQIVVEKQETHIVMEHQKRPFGLPPPMRKPCFVIEIELPHATLLLLSYKSCLYKNIYIYIYIYSCYHLLLSFIGKEALLTYSHEIVRKLT